MVKVSPVIEGGAYPAKAAVGESIPIRAQVFREGHDAVNASVVLTDPDGKETAGADAPDHPARLRLVDGLGHARDARARGRSGSRAGATRGRPGCTTPRSRSRPASTSQLVCTEGKALFSAAADRAAERPAPSRPPPCSAGAGQEPRLRPAGRGPAGGRAGRRRPRRHGARTARASWSPPPRTTRSTSTAGRRCSPPGTSSSPAPRAPRYDEETEHLDLRHLRLLARAARGGGRDGLRRRLPAADPPHRDHLPQGPEQHPDPGTERSRLAVGDRQQRGRPRRHPSRPRRLRRLRPVRGQGASRSAWRSRWTSPCRPRRTIRG